MRKEIEQAIKDAERDPSLFFGPTPDVVLKEWKVKTHPDKWLGNEEMAKDWFVRLSFLAGECGAQEPIGPYRIVRKLCTGDLCDILVGEKGGAYFLIKKPLVKAVAVMKKEVDNLRKVCDGANDTAIHLFPRYVESVEGCNVFHYADNLEPVSSLARRYPDGIGGRHTGWLTKRILLALSWTHGAGVVHGAVTDEHVLVCKQTHGIVLCDWICSGAPGDAIKIVPKRYKHYYTTAKDKKLSTALDVAMAGRVLAGLMGADAPRKLRSFVSAMASGTMGAFGAWELHQDFDALLKAEYGAPKFVELV